MLQRVDLKSRISDTAPSSSVARTATDASATHSLRASERPWAEIARGPFFRELPKRVLMFTSYSSAIAGASCRSFLRFAPAMYGRAQFSGSTTALTSKAFRPHIEPAERCPYLMAPVGAASDPFPIRMRATLSRERRASAQGSRPSLGEVRAARCAMRTSPTMRIPCPYEKEEGRAHDLIASVQARAVQRRGGVGVIVYVVTDICGNGEPGNATLHS
jgi:hypothetical protein